MTLAVAFITSRERCEFGWFADSLHNQGHHVDQVVVVDLFADQDGRRRAFKEVARHDIEHVEPKPNIWQGKFKITRENWWAKANALNTAICLCNCDWLAFVDDRCVLAPNWLKAVKEAMAGNYAMAGSYEKRVDMRVENGVIIDGKLDVTFPGSPGGMDHRESLVGGTPVKCSGGWWFGCSNAMPLEWIIQINGYSQKYCDSVSAEDSITGIIMENNGFDIRYDPRAKVIEDRTPDQLGTPMKRSSKEKHPYDTNDKTHIALRWARTAKRSVNDFDIRELRDRIQRGEPWPVPDPTVKYRDWFDQQLIKDFQ